MSVGLPYTLTPALVSADTVEPVTLAEAKLWIRQDYSQGTVEDAMVSGLITAAREWFENAMDRSLLEKVWRLKLPWFCNVIELPYPPLSSVVSITYLDADGATQTLATTIYNVVTATTPARIELASEQTWPVTDVHPEAVTVSFRVGTDAAPEMVKAGIKMLVAYWYGFRGDEERTPKPPASIDAIVITARSYRF